MKKRSKPLYFVWAMLICLCLYSLCSFLLVRERSAAFWGIYNFSMAAIALEFIIPFLLFQNRDVQALPFLGLSPTVFTTAFAGVQLVLGVILLLTHAGIKIAIILQAVVLGLYLLLMIAFLSGISAIAEQKDDQQNATRSIRSLTGKAEILYRNTADPAKKALFKKVYEALRYTDPVSTGADVLAMDDALQDDMEALAAQAKTVTAEELSSAVENLLEKIQERAILCRDNK